MCSPFPTACFRLGVVTTLLFLGLAANAAAHTLPLSFLMLVPDADYLHLELTFNPFELTFFSELDANKDRRLDSSEWEDQPGNAIRRIADCLKVSVNGKPVTAEVVGIIPDFDSHHATLRAHYAVDARHGEVRVVSSLAALTSGSHFTQVTFGREGGVQSARLDAQSAAVTFGKTNETGKTFPPVRESSLAARFFPAVLLALGALVGLVWLVRRGTSWHVFGAERGHPGRSGSAPHEPGRISEPAAKWRLLRPGRPRSAEQMPAPATSNRSTQTHPPVIESRRTS